jgi:hypothetical protein
MLCTHIFPCAIEVYPITKHGKLHTKIIFLLIQNDVDFIPHNSLKKYFDFHLQKVFSLTNPINGQRDGGNAQ